MAKRKKKHQEERVIEPLVKPGEPLETPTREPVEMGSSNLQPVVQTAG